MTNFGLMVVTENILSSTNQQALSAVKLLTVPLTKAADDGDEASALREAHQALEVTAGPSFLNNLQARFETDCRATLVCAFEAAVVLVEPPASLLLHLLIAVLHRLRQVRCINESAIRILFNGLAERSGF